MTILSVRQLGCCGAYGDVSGDYSWAIYKAQSLWYKTYKPDGKSKYPRVKYNYNIDYSEWFANPFYESSLARKKYEGAVSSLFL